MRYWPVQLDVRGRKILVLGASGEVVPKIERLAALGAAVAVVAPGEVDEAVASLAASCAISLERRPFDEGDLDGAFVVLVATSEAALARGLHAWAVREGRLLCTVDRPETSTFVHAAIVDVPELTIAFGSGGQSPGTLRRIREDLTALFSDPRFGRYVRALGELRARVPREARIARMSEAVKGFAIEAKLVFPAWFERGEEP